MKRMALVQLVARQVVGGAQATTMGTDSRQRLVLQFNQAVEAGLGSPALHKLDQIGANQGRDRGPGLRRLDAGEPVELFVNGYGDVLHRHRPIVVVIHTIGNLPRLRYALHSILR